MCGTEAIDGRSPPKSTQIAWPEIPRRRADNFPYPSNLAYYIEIPETRRGPATVLVVETYGIQHTYGGLKFQTAIQTCSRYVHKHTRFYTRLRVVFIPSRTGGFGRRGRSHLGLPRPNRWNGQVRLNALITKRYYRKNRGTKTFGAKMEPCKVSD